VAGVGVTGLLGYYLVKNKNKKSIDYQHLDALLPS